MKTFNLFLVSGLLLLTLCCACRENEIILNPHENLRVEARTAPGGPKIQQDQFIAVFVEVRGFL